MLRAAGLPGHWSPHSLRHTFASLLLQAGESPTYVQRQLGHASIKLTVDTYGRWLPLGNPAAVDRLDDAAVHTAAGGEGAHALGSTGACSAEVVANPVADCPGTGSAGSAQLPARMVGVGGEPSGIRTQDPLIKSQVLYRLS